MRDGSVREEGEREREERGERRNNTRKREERLPKHKVLINERFENFKN